MNRRDEVVIKISRDLRDKLYSMRGPLTNYDQVLMRLIETGNIGNHNDVLRSIYGGKNDKSSNKKTRK